MAANVEFSNSPGGRELYLCDRPRMLIEDSAYAKQTLTLEISVRWLTTCAGNRGKPHRLDFGRMPIRCRKRMAAQRTGFGLGCVFLLGNGILAMEY